jgi:outer membrane lipoprotein-sorting protein
MKYLKHMKFSALLFVMGVAFGARTAAANESPLETPSILSADFVMSRTISALKSELKSKGHIILGGTGRLRWETLSPAESTLIINGGKGWIWYPDLNVTKSFDLGTDPIMRVMSEHLSALTAGRFDSVQSLYYVSAPKDGRRTLVPKSPEIKKLFKEMQVAVNEKGAVTEVLLVSANGDKTSIVFQHIVSNPKLNEDLFREPKSR